MRTKSYSEFLRLNEEEEGKQYLQSLQEISTFAQEIREMIDPSEDLDAWIQDKITIAHHNMDAILGYYKSQKKDVAPGPGEQTSMNLNDN